MTPDRAQDDRGRKRRREDRLLRQRDQDRNLALEVVPLLPTEANSPAPLLPVALRCPNGWRRYGSARLLIGTGVVAAGEGGHGRTIFGKRQNLMCPYCAPASKGHTLRELGC